MAEVTFVAWGVEYEYACGRLGDVRKAGKVVIPGALKNRWPHATHMSLDVRGIWCRDPGNPAKDHEALFRISEDPACWSLFSFILQTVMAYQATSKVALVFSLVCILAALGSVRVSMQLPAHKVTMMKSEEKIHEIAHRALTARINQEKAKVRASMEVVAAPAAEPETILDDTEESIVMWIKGAALSLLKKGEKGTGGMAAANEYGTHGKGLGRMWPMWMKWCVCALVAWQQHMSLARMAKAQAGCGRSFKGSITVEGMCLEEAKKKRPGEEQECRYVLFKVPRGRNIPDRCLTNRVEMMNEGPAELKGALMQLLDQESDASSSCGSENGSSSATSSASALTKCPSDEDGIDLQSEGSD
eukprot:symbB.v1.2.012976.t1/scaffold908.1/size153097/9